MRIQFTTVCSVENCLGKSRTHGLCDKHYYRWRKWGDPLFLKNDGHSNLRAYTSWQQMFTRCYNPNATAFSYYGSRGITICDRWRSFANFFADMGERPLKHSLDRIDNNGHYEPGNCRWATASQQSSNQRPRTLKAFCKYGHSLANVRVKIKSDGRKTRYCPECDRISHRAKYKSRIIGIR